VFRRTRQKKRASKSVYISHKNERDSSDRLSRFDSEFGHELATVHSKFLLVIVVRLISNGLDHGIEKPMTFVKIESPEEKSRICEKVLRSLPQWFGIESANLDYIKDVQEMETWAALEAEAIGFISLNKHNTQTAEIHVMGLLPQFHGKNIAQLKSLKLFGASTILA
jgi:hypothetical protein